MVNLRSYWDAFPLRWTFYWFVLPNLAIMLMWFVGGPPMTLPLALIGLLALVVAQLPWTWIKRLALLAMIAEMSYFYVCLLFNLKHSDFAMLPGFIMEVRPLQSPLYVIAALVLLISAGLALVKAPRVPRFATPMSYLLGFCVIFAALCIDTVATASTRGSYSASPPEGATFESATGASGVAHPGPDHRNLVIVMVEGFGVPAEAVGKSIFASDWDRPHWRDRYEVKHGKVHFYGSTTNGELRELCEQWAHYASFDFSGNECIPRRYRSAGYSTSAYHGFHPMLFERDSWYPELGFQHFAFREQLEGAGAARCPGVFPGACDSDIGPIIHRKLAAADGPQLIYWLTLNTHLPIVADQTLGTDNCTLGPPEWAEANPQLCRLFLVHHHLADAIDAIASDETLPPTDFLVVGDHFPPFFDRRTRSMFEGGTVPWIFLKAREGPGAGMANSAGQRKTAEPHKG